MLITDLKPVAVLNNLIVINNERMEGYDLATRRTDAAVLKALFSRLTETSATCMEELLREVHKLGGFPQLGCHAEGELNLAWRYVNEALEKKDHRALLNSCYYEEDLAVRSYEMALASEDESITTEHFRLMNRQLELLEADHDKVKNLLNVLVKE